MAPQIYNEGSFVLSSIDIIIWWRNTPGIHLLTSASMMAETMNKTNVRCLHQMVIKLFGSIVFIINLLLFGYLL